MNNIAVLFASLDRNRTKQLMGKYTYINALLLLAVLVGTGFLFFGLGINASDLGIGITSSNFLPTALLVVAYTGVWTALKATSFQQTLLLQTISPVTIFWLRTISVLFFILPVTVVTICPYLLGFGIESNFTWDVLTLNFLTPVILLTVVALLSAGITFVIRRVSRNYLLRTILLIGLFGGLAALFYGSSAFTDGIVSIWMSQDLNHQFTLLISLLASLAMSVTLLELVFTNMPIAIKPLPKYWQMMTSRGIVNSYDAALALINREFLHYTRDASFHRRLIAYTLLLALFVSMGAIIFSTTSAARLDIFAFSLVIALVSGSISYKSGGRSQKYLENHADQPVSQRLVTWSFWAASLVVMTLTSVFFIGLTVVLSEQDWSLITFQLAILALSAHLLSFYFGSKNYEHHQEHGLNDLTAPLIILAISVVPIIFVSAVSTLWTVAVLTLWLMVLGLYLRLQNAKKY